MTLLLFIRKQTNITKQQPLRILQESGKTAHEPLTAAGGEETATAERNIVVNQLIRNNLNLDYLLTYT